MKRSLFLLALLSLLPLTAEELPFAEFRKKAAQIEKRSSEDYALGRELAAAMQKTALERKPFFDRSRLFFETVLWRGGRLWFPEKYWRDRSLITNRKFFSKSRSYEKNTALTYRLMRDYDADGCNYFANKSAANINLDAGDICGLSPEEFALLPTVCPSRNPYWQMLDKTLKSIPGRTHTWRIGGKPVYLTYEGDIHKGPREMKEFFDTVKKRSGSDLVYIVDITGNHIHLYPDTQYAQHRAVAATDLLRYFDHISDYLESAIGVEYGVYLGRQDLTLHAAYIDEVLLPLFGAACGQKRFDGKRILSLKVVSNYTNCNGSQTVYADGTKTLRKYLELCRKYKVDLIQGFEWDEHNENTNLEPTVAKPMAYKRIIRYYMGQLKGKAPAPLPGDDPDRPNVIVSTRRQIGCGEELELELLNVPDGGKEPYSIFVELFDQSGKTVWRSEKIDFDPLLFRDVTLTVPTEKYPDSLFLQPRLLADFKGKSRTFDGLPPVVVRGTVAEDHTWFSTPLRNLLTAEGTVRYTEGMKIRPGAREVTLDANLTFDDKLISAEAVQNSQDIFVFDPKDEFRTADGMNRLFKLGIRSPNALQFELAIDLPSARKFDFSAPGDPAKILPLSRTQKFRMDRSSRRDDFFIVPGTVLADAVLNISGKFLNGKTEGRAFSCRFRLADVLKTGVAGTVLPEGVQFALEADPRPIIMALELGTNRVNFSAPLLIDTPDAVTALRMVSQSGKIWWSRAHAPAPSGKPVPVTALSSKRGVVDFTLPASRVPHIVYDFDQPLFGNILPTAAGREFYAHVGGYISLATGFEGLMGGLSMPGSYIPGAAKMPEWRQLPGGGRSLVFNGKDTQGVFFPKTAIPQRHGFTLILDLKPEDVQRDQIIFEQRNNHSYITGFLIRLVKGKLVLEHNFREPHKDRSALTTWGKYPTDLELKPGVRQKLVLRCDRRTAVLEAGGKKAEFPAECMDLWLTPSAFGGRGNERFAGELFGVEIIHSPAYK